MITVRMTRSHNGDITSFTMDGHANYAGHGQDIVCAGASAVAFGAVNAILTLTETQPGIELGEDGGYLEVIIPDDLSKETHEKTQLLLEAMLVQLQTIEADYGEFIKITFNR
ncbi:ribosomal-processing cysteine protease Prp [Mangrovibacillus cuniculi]|uniref:Ribosomal processing cysteine protease Prp n=1 Tax=Mangrovibacillus cuniculi TaxID=2593652 RepID=A0A7S8CBR3_9BACI|nr:ribosomal-processing cysteine protease Prp [Mangrovibacillus cuniculi]QPC47041.1 ribosomal-processing cysteine protease Prp [Mangrovibacillus cuniculi]